MADPAVREAISRQARAWLEANALILDTETTGLGDDAEVVELTVIDCAGAVLLDTLVRPSGPVPAEAAAIHGITDAMLAEAPTWSEIHARFCDLVEGRQVVIYNHEFDVRVIGQTARRYGLPAPQGFDLVLDPGRIHCAMRNRSLSGVLCPPAPTRNNPSHIHQGGAGSDQGDSDQQQVAAA